MINIFLKSWFSNHMTRFYLPTPLQPLPFEFCSTSQGDGPSDIDMADVELNAAIVQHLKNAVNEVSSAEA